MGKGPHYFLRKGQLFAARTWRGAGLGLGQLSREEERVSGTKALAAQSATPPPLAIISLHCEPREP